MSRLINIGVSTMLSGGIIGSGSAENYVSDAARVLLAILVCDFVCTCPDNFTACLRDAALLSQVPEILGTEREGQVSANKITDQYRQQNGTILPANQRAAGGCQEKELF